MSVRWHVQYSLLLEPFLDYVNPVHGLTFSFLNIYDKFF
jgi:hypothetical protein